MNISPQIEFNPLTSGAFDQLLANYSGVKKIILTDETVFDLWMEDLLTHHAALHDAEIIQIPPGEESKSLEICHQIWQTLSEYEIARNDLIINFGGGVITDLGGFIASTYKRGLDFVNIPTTLLAQVDASVGGKTGIDLGGYKNQIGVFANPVQVFIDQKFHSTLPEDQLKSGFAEMLKHGLIQDRLHWEGLLAIKDRLSEGVPIALVQRSIEIKAAIVELDPKEAHIRKLLNFGHTLGHAIEGTLLLSNQPVPHGFAVAWGMQLESELAYREKLLPLEDKQVIIESIEAIYPPLKLTEAQKNSVLSLVKNDKKNKHKHLNFTLIKSIGNGVTDQETTIETLAALL